MTAAPALDRWSRLLGPGEEVMWRMNEAGSLNFVMLARVRGELARGPLEAALAEVQRRHPLLRVRVDAGGRVPRFVADGCPPIPLRVLAGAVFADVVKAEVNEGFAWETGPLIRVAVLPEPGGFRLLAAFHHVIGDATSGTFFVRDLLRAYAHAHEGRPGPALEPLPPLPPQDDLVPGLGSLGLIPRALGFAARSLWAKARGTTRPAMDNPAWPITTEVIPRLLNEATMAALLERARTEGTTVHGAICAAMLLATARDVGGSGPHRMGCISPINIRRQLAPPVGDDIGFFISGVVTRHRVAPGTPLWRLAREVKEALERARARGDDLTGLVLQRYSRSTQDPVRLAATMSDMLAATVTITNLGQLEVDEVYGPFALEELGFCAAGNDFPRAAAGVMVTTFRGRGSFHYVYGNPSYARDRAHAACDDAIGLLEAAAR